MAADRSAEKEYVLRIARDNDVKFIRLWFTDILGKLKGFALDVDGLEDPIERGVGVRRLYHRELCPHRRERYEGLAGPNHLCPATLASPPKRRGPHVLRHRGSFG